MMGIPYFMNDWCSPLGIFTVVAGKPGQKSQAAHGRYIDDQKMESCMHYLNKKRCWIGLSALFLLLLSQGVWAADRLAVKASIANLRNGAGTKYKVLWQVEKYHPFIVIGKKGKWYEVKDFEGDTAWIHSSLLGKINTVISTKSKCNVREKGNSNSPVVLRAERGVPFKVLKRNGDWIRIKHADGETGWIHKSLVW